MLIKNYKKSITFKSLNFLFLKKKTRAKIEKQTEVYINVFGFKNKTLYCIYTSKQLFEKNDDLFLLYNSKSFCYIFMKDFNRFVTGKSKRGDKKHFP